MEVDFKWHPIKTINNSVDLVAEFYIYVDDKYRDYIQIYTDGSKDPESGRTGSAIFRVNQGGEESKRITDDLNVYTVELYAIMMALERMD